MAKYTEEQFREAVERAIRDFGPTLNKIREVRFDGTTVIIVHSSNAGKGRHFARYQLLDDGKVTYSAGYPGQLNIRTFAMIIAENLHEAYDSEETSRFIALNWVQRE